MPEELAKKHKRPLWTEQCMDKSKTYDLDDMKEDNNINGNINRRKMKRLPKKRESLLLPPSSAPLKARFFDRNQIKRNSWNGPNEKKNDAQTVEDRLKNILFQAQQHHQKNDKQNKTR